MDLFDRVIHAIEGEGPPKTWQTQRGPVVVRRAVFVDWTHRIERTYTPTALECLALVNSVIGYFNMDEERRIVDAWSKALLHAAETGAVRPRDPVTLLPIENLPDDFADWGISLADADKFVADMGMTWSMTSVVELMVKQADSALSREHDLVAGAREVVPKPKPEAPTASAKFDWKQLARVYATDAWDARSNGGAALSKKALSRMVSKRFEQEGIQGPRGRLSPENIEREALSIWKRPTGPRNTPGTP